ncbi:hypothetical protein MTR67_052097 [Solanum verrucosum]|uniref:Uncharacterized protein n=1 Tax=Solanum verrucosum TaxID=315347 RepID=A0AAF0ZZN3_SOLVR|nr:hypothetical protein MTR67_052097 [Solanum verrucosum]
MSSGGSISSALERISHDTHILTISFGTADPWQYYPNYRRPNGAFSTSQAVPSVRYEDLPLHDICRGRPLSAGTPSPTGASPQLSTMRIRDSSSEQSDAMDGTPSLTQCYVHPDVSPLSTATPSATPDEMLPLVPGQKDKLGRVMIEPDGSSSVGTIAREMKKELGRTPIASEVFKKTRVWKKENESDPDVWVEERAKQTFKEFQHYVAENLDSSVEMTPELSTQIWKEKVVGGTHKGRVYGLGSRNNVRRLQLGLEGIGSSSQAEALDDVQIVVMSDQIVKLTAALAESERRRVAKQKSMSKTVYQIQKQVMNLPRGTTTSTPEESDDYSIDSEDDCVGPTP